MFSVACTESCTFSKRMSPIAWNTQDSLFSGLWYLRVHIYTDKKFQNREKHLSCWRFTGTQWQPTWTPARTKYSFIKKLATNNYHLPFQKSDWGKTFLWDTILTSLSAGFPNTVTIPCSNNSSSDLLACCVMSNWVWTQQQSQRHFEPL